MKHRRPPSQTHRGMPTTLDAVRALAGTRPTCCLRHQMQHAQLMSLVAGAPGGRCILCQGDPYWRGMFIPRESLLYGGNARQQRLLGYYLCASCCVQTDTAAIEARLRELVRQARAAWN